jgi:predicted nucleotidyltransferase component of viral defense system
MIGKNEINRLAAEKIRALIQRSYTAPRDYYDIWYLSKHVENVDWQKVVNAFKIKTAYKGLSFACVKQLVNEDNDRVLKAAWKNSLEHQICADKLVDYSTVRNELLALFERIFN